MSLAVLADWHRGPPESIDLWLAGVQVVRTVNL
jgi:hypothetical protein